MRLIGSQTSPFVRMVRVTAAELGMEYDFQETGPFATMSAEDKALIENSNPLMKIPVLHDDGHVIFDSRIIINHLVRKASDQARHIPFTTPLTLEQENLITVIQGIADAAVLRFIFTSTTDLDPQEGYLARSYTRIEKGLHYLNDHKALGYEGFGIPEIMLLCVLEWFDKRGIYDWHSFGALSTLHQKFKDRPSLAQTRIPEDA